MTKSGGASPKTTPVGWVLIDRHRHDGFTIRWRRGDPIAYVLNGQRLGDHGTANTLGTVPYYQQDGPIFPKYEHWANDG